jgi:hypothetical protein
VRDQQAHDLAVRGATVARHDRLKQRRPSEAVDVVDVNPRLQ